MTQLKKLMEFRENIHHFKQDDPGRDKIQQILKDAHDLVPVKNNLVAYHIDVYGPQHADEKKAVALQTVTGYEKRQFKNLSLEEQEEIYAEWRRRRESMRKDPSYENRQRAAKYKGFAFNEQVTAPYLLVYYQKPGFPTEKQLKKGYKNLLIDYNDNRQWMIAASMHGYGVTLLAAEQRLHASFCKCYYHSDTQFTNILAPLRKGWENIAFLLGIGYKDGEMPYYKNPNVPDIEDIVTWK